MLVRIMEEPLLHPLIFVERCKYTNKNIYLQMSIVLNNYNSFSLVSNLFPMS